jgi:hypothetical protein
LFRLGKRFDITLLFQSIAMLTAMLVLLEIVIRYKPDLPFRPLIRHNSVDSSSSSSSDEHSIAAAIEQRVELKWYQRTFWGWDNYLDYINCLLIFTSVVGVLYIFLHKYSAFIEVLGFMSLGLESTLPLPQLLTNFKNRNTDGFSILILATWVSKNIYSTGVKIYLFFLCNSFWVMDSKHFISFIPNLLFNLLFVHLFNFHLIQLLYFK